VNYNCEPFFKDVFLFTDGKKFTLNGITKYDAVPVEKETLHLTGEMKDVPVRCVKELKPITSEFINKFKGEMKDRFKFSYNKIRKQFYNE